MRLRPHMDRPRTPSTAPCEVDGVYRRSRPSTFLARVHRQRVCAGARLCRPGVRADHGLGSSRSRGTARPDRRTIRPAGDEPGPAAAGVHATGRAGRDDASADPLAPGVRRRIPSAIRTSRRWRGRSTTCSPPGIRTARERSTGAAGPRGRAPARRSRTPRRGVGQTLTDVMLWIEGLALRIPDELRAARAVERNRAAPHRGGPQHRAPAPSGRAGGARGCRTRSPPWPARSSDRPGFRSPARSSRSRTWSPSKSS